MSSSEQDMRKLAPGFHTRLRLERARLGLSQAEMGEKAGLRRLSQNVYEQGHRTPGLDYLVSIEALGVNIEYLLFGAVRSDAPEQSENTLRAVHVKAFEFVETFVQGLPEQTLGAEGRRALYDLARATLIAAAERGEFMDDAVSAMLPKRPEPMPMKESAVPPQLKKRPYKRPYTRAVKADRS